MIILGGWIKTAIWSDTVTCFLSDIDTEELRHILERFYRGDESLSAKGNGLGLSLAQASARSHRGNIKVKNKPSTGQHVYSDASANIAIDSLC
ncbi:MAG: ATP-binding protein [Planctomycetota bacterium]